MNAEQTNLKKPNASISIYNTGMQALNQRPNICHGL